MKIFAVLILFFGLTGCSLDFRLKGYVYNHTITKLEKDYLEEADKKFGKMPAADVYKAGLKKYNRILKVEKLSRSEKQAEFTVQKILLEPEFAKEFLDYLSVATKERPQQTAEEVLNQFLKTHPEPWPTKEVQTVLKISQKNKEWIVESESSL